MYRMGQSEFFQYEIASRRLKEIRIRNKQELEAAYDGIHPTRCCFDYDSGKIYSESVNPVDYAIYLVEMKEEHKRIEKYWSIRAQAFEKAQKILSEQELNHLNDTWYRNYQHKQSIKAKLQKELEKIIARTPELKRPTLNFNQLEDLEEIDRIIDNMNMDELMEDYWDKEGLESGQ